MPRNFVEYVSAFCLTTWLACSYLVFAVFHNLVYVEPVVDNQVHFQDIYEFGLVSHYGVQVQVTFHGLVTWREEGDVMRAFDGLQKFITFWTGILDGIEEVT